MRVQPGTERQSMRIAFLWTHRSGYLDACLGALVARDVEVFLSCQPPEANAPFALPALPPSATLFNRSGASDAYDLVSALEEFRPEVVLMSSWHDRAYRRALRTLRGQTFRVLCMDNQWHGTLKQRAGSATSRVYLHPLYDAALVAGDRQAAFARRLGFPQDRLWYPLYSANTGQLMNCRFEPQNRSFIYVGRLVREKGIDVLLDGHALHHQTHPSPWSLHIYGTGPLESECEDRPGVEFHGFVQPSELPITYGRHGCFVLASRFEPWGVVIHEAAASGLPILCSVAAGASETLVRDAYNGFLVETDSAQLANAMNRVASLSDEDRRIMGLRSRQLASHLSPDIWAESLVRNAWDATSLLD